MIVETQGLLFDMDGVLISSIASVNRCWRRWAQHYDVPGWETYTIPHGVRAMDIMKSLRPDFTAEQAAVGLRTIEDMEIADTAAGVAAGSRVMAVLGTHPAEELYAAGAEWVVASLVGVKAVISEAGLQIEFEALAR